VVDASGRIVYENANALSQNGGARVSIATGELANGLYQVTVQNASSTRTLPLQVVR